MAEVAQSDKLAIFQVDCTRVSLSGVILSGHLTLYNPHQMLAVIFESEALPPFLEIEPTRGMVMQGERKIIRLRCRPESRASLGKIQQGERRLIIRGSYFSEYNKKVMAKNNLKGWSTISKQLQEIALPVSFNFAEEVEKVREEAQRSGSLRGSRKMNSFEKFQESSIRRTKNERLNEDLDFIFRNEEFKRTYDSKYSRQSHSPRSHPSQQASTAPPQLFRPFANGPDKQVVRSEIPSAIPSPVKSPKAKQAPEQPASPFPTKTVRKGPIDAQRRKQMRGLDLIILAIIAALFLGLGQSMGRTLKS